MRSNLRNPDGREVRFGTAMCGKASKPRQTPPTALPAHRGLLSCMFSKGGVAQRAASPVLSLLYPMVRFAR